MNNGAVIARRFVVVLRRYGNIIRFVKMARQSAVNLLYLILTREQRRAAAPPYRYSIALAFRVTGARIDGSVICHCERSEAICS